MQNMLFKSLGLRIIFRLSRPFLNSVNDNSPFPSISNSLNTYSTVFFLEANASKIF